MIFKKHFTIDVTYFVFSLPLPEEPVSAVTDL